MWTLLAWPQLWPVVWLSMGSSQFCQLESDLLFLTWVDASHWLTAYKAAQEGICLHLKDIQPMQDTAAWGWTPDKLWLPFWPLSDNAGSFELHLLQWQKLGLDTQLLRVTGASMFSSCCFVPNRGTATLVPVRICVTNFAVFMYKAKRRILEQLRLGLCSQFL